MKIKIMVQLIIMIYPSNIESSPVLRVEVKEEMIDEKLGVLVQHIQKWSKHSILSSLFVLNIQFEMCDFLNQCSFKYIDSSLQIGLNNDGVRLELILLLVFPIRATLHLCV